MPWVDDLKIEQTLGLSLYRLTFGGWPNKTPPILNNPPFGPPPHFFETAASRSLTAAG